MRCRTWMASVASGQISTLVCWPLVFAVTKVCSHRVVVFSAGSARTYLPAPVIEAMRMSWFNLPPDPLGLPMLVRNCSAFEKCDIVFRFKGEGTGVVDFRCNALYFLASPWRTPHGYVAPLQAMRTPLPGDPPPAATLGLVRHVVFSDHDMSLTSDHSRPSEFLLERYREARWHT